MSIILFKKVDGEWTDGRFEVPQMHHLMQDGWVTIKKEPVIEEEIIEEDFAPLLEDLPNAEIRELARVANIENWDDARIKTLTTKLREMDNGTAEG